MQERTLDVDRFSEVNVQVNEHLLIEELNPTYPLIVDIMEKGDLAVVGCYKGQQRVVANISRSAYNINILLRTHNGLKYVGPQGMKNITCIDDYMEVLIDWIS